MVKEKIKINSTAEHKYVVYMTILRTRVRSIKEVSCLCWGRRDLKLLVSTSKLLNESFREEKIIRSRIHFKREAI